MKLVWLDAEHTKAQLTRGRLWWRRRAVVHREGLWEWYFQPDWVPAPSALASWLDHRRYEARKQPIDRAIEGAWRPIRHAKPDKPSAPTRAELPEARLIRDKDRR
jgi:hypothetical protein